jgi:hypothetical protein
LVTVPACPASADAVVGAAGGEVVVSVPQAATNIRNGTRRTIADFEEDGITTRRFALNASSVQARLRLAAWRALSA